MSEKISIGQALDFGTEHAMKGDHPTAINYFRGVLVHQPTNFEAVERLGSSLFDMGYLFEALYWFWRGIKISPKGVWSNTNYGLCLGEIGHFDESIEYLSRAAALANKDKNTSPEAISMVHSNLGNSWVKLGQYKDAIPSLDRAIQFNPANPFAHYNRGVCMRWLNRNDEALLSLGRALELNKTRSPERLSVVNESDILYNRGIIKLLQGDIKGGFADYEHRLTTSENTHPNFRLPVEKKWRGEPIEGKTVLVYGEQGLGDTIQFARFLPTLVEIGAKVKIVLPTALRDFITVPGVEVLVGGEQLDDYDHWVGLMSLPMMFGIDSEDDIKAFGPWEPDVPEERLVAAAKWLDTLRGTLDGETKTLVGVCWTGNFQHKNDKHRSVPLKVFEQLFSAPNCEFICLQPVRQEDEVTVAKIGKNFHRPRINDWHDTAALTTFLDQVVSVDTSVAHLSASIGTPTSILIPEFSTDWRWQLKREDSPWYPMATLFRQDVVGDWRRPVLRVLGDRLSGEP